MPVRRQCETCNGQAMRLSVQKIEENKTMDIKPFAILLVGENAITAPEVMRWIENNNAHCEFAFSCHEACMLAAAKDFDVVLSEYHLLDRTALPLLDSLSGSSSTLYMCT